MEIDSQSYTSYDILEPLVLVRKLPAREIVTFNGITDRHAEADPVPRSSANSSRISTKISCLSPNALCGAIEPANRLEELVYSMAGVIRRMVYILWLVWMPTYIASHA
ncbi:hypothetical protein BJY00DRAFT_272463 [Aspergillus carlsbadensis]|nr:hypothetical protein BJY00DRAFT_272463 [Aspergillus carlsbadensis]